MAKKVSKISKKTASAAHQELAGIPPREKAKEKYFSGVGRRKLAVARVRVFYLGSKEQETAKEHDISVNNKSYNEYFKLPDLREIVALPLKSAGQNASFVVSVKVRGGGMRGQAEAIRLGIVRALVLYDENLRKSFRDLGYLTRDARVVERKKAGLKKARRAPQWKKR